MIGVPFRRVELVTKLGPAQVATRLQQVTFPHYRWFRFPPRQKQFVGPITAERFLLARAIRGLNSYLPRVAGSIAPSLSGSRVSLTMTLHPVIIGLVLGTTMWVCYIAVAVPGNLTGKVVLVTVFGAFHVLMWLVGFEPEANWAEERIRAILEVGDAEVA